MTNNAFDKFGIDHLSASSINLFISNPSLWIVRYLLKIKWEGNPATARGTASDNAVGYFLTSRNTKKPLSKLQCINKATKDFVRLTDYQREHNEYGIDEDKATKEKSLLPSFVETSIDFYEQLIEPNKPVGYQQEIELQLEELPIVITGFLDLQYEDTVRDIKTVSRMPSVVPSPTNRQLAVYAAATGKIPIVDYVCVTKTRAEVKPIVVTDVDKYLEEVKRAAICIMNVLSYSDDIKEISKLYFPDLDHWQWSDKERVSARQLWSIN